MNSRRNWLFVGIFAVTLALRLCHAHILWADEDYHLAAGIQSLHGKLLYRDLWYDKPPLAAWVYAAVSAFPGWPLRLFDALYVLAVSIATWRFARDLWGRREAMLAAGLMAFFLNFDLPAAIVPIASSAGGEAGPIDTIVPSAGLTKRPGRTGVTRHGSPKKYAIHKVRMRPIQPSGAATRKPKTAMTAAARTNLTPSGCNGERVLRSTAARRLS